MRVLSKILVGNKTRETRYASKDTTLIHNQDQGKRLDLVFLITIIILTLFGLMMIYDVSQIDAYRNYGDKYFFIKQQLIWVFLGAFSLGFFSIFDYRALKKVALPFFLIAVFLLILVFIPGLGVSAGGANRWLKISALTIQPTEIIKLASVIFFAALFSKKSSVLSFLIPFGLVVIIVGVLQKDLGSAIVYSMIALSLYFMSGAPIVTFLLFLIGGTLSLILFIVTSSYRRHRILAFLDPFSDPQGYSYHISQVLIALGSGGLWGLGIGQSRQKFAYIPEVTTDSIFSVIGEEFGFAGGVILVGLIALLIIRGFKIADAAPDLFGKLLGSGLIIWLGSQAIVNLAAMVSLVPLTGVPLPFISYGGSALLANLVAVGILLNISKRGIK